jgi:hypothetical protein
MRAAYLRELVDRVKMPSQDQIRFLKYLPDSPTNAAQALNSDWDGFGRMDLILNYRLVWAASFRTWRSVRYHAKLLGHTFSPSQHRVCFGWSEKVPYSIEEVLSM